MTSKSDHQSQKDKKLDLLVGFDVQNRIHEEPVSTNDVIDYLFKVDLGYGFQFMVEDRGWRYYVHLNKQTINLERDGLIERIGTKKGSLNKSEKTYKITQKGLDLLGS